MALGTEDRGRSQDHLTILQTGDVARAHVIRSYPILLTGGVGTDFTIFTPSANRVFVIYAMAIGVSAADVIDIWSGPTASGTKVGTVLGTPNAIVQWLHASGLPLIVGLVAGQALVMAHTGANNVVGFVTVGERLP